MSTIASNCVVCRNPALMMCQRCNEGYCSPQCQHADWNKHKYYCIPMPPLVPLYQPEMSSNRRRLSSLSVKENLSIPIDTAKCDINSNEIVKDVQKLSNVWKTEFELPVNEFFECFVMHIPKDIDNVIWVIEKKNEANLKVMMEYLSQCFETNSLKTAERVSVGELYVAVVETQVHRVVVIDVISTDAVVRYIDCGKKVTVKCNSLYSPKPKMAETKAFAVCTKIQREHVDTIVGMVISLRLLGTKNREGILLAQVKPQDISNEGLIQLLKTKLNIRLIKLSSDARMALVQITSPDEISSKLNDSMKNQQFLSKLKLNADISNFILSARSTNGWRRAFLIDQIEENNTYLVYEVDEGHISICNEIKGLPDELRSQPLRVFAIVKNEKSGDFNMEQFKNSEYLSLEMLTSGHATNVNGNKHKCLLSNDSKASCEVTAFGCLGQLRTVGSLAAKKSIPDGDKVHISHVCNHSEVYVNTVGTKEYGKLFAALAVKCPHYNDERVMVGDTVLVEESEGVFFRAEVVLLAGDKKTTYNVFDIDTGKSLLVPYSSLRKACDFVSYLPVHLVRVKLSTLCNVPNNIVPENSQSLHNLKEHVKKCTEFKIQFQNTFSLEAKLFYESGTELNADLLGTLFDILKQPTAELKVLEGNVISNQAADNLNKSKQTNICDVERSGLKLLCEDDANVKSLPPSPPDSPEPSLKDIRVDVNIQATETAENVVQRFTVDEIKFQKIPCGIKVNLHKLDVSRLDSEGVVTVAYLANDSDLQLYQKCRNLEASYGSSPRNHVPSDYMPNEREVCMALFAEDNSWYRAVCLQRKGNVAKIKFIDYGNQEHVAKENLQPIPKEMMYVCHANTGVIKGGKDKTLSLQQLESGSAFWKVTELGDGTYQLHLPDEVLN